jgi:PH (Pleckstrin Homology) domain-containing protein
MPQISKEAVAGVWPIELGEAQITQTFPSISSTAFGRLLGTVYSLPFPIGFIIHIVTVPLPVLTAVSMYVFSRFRRYQLTSLRVRVRYGIRGTDGPEVKLEDFDDIRVVVRPGQAFYRAGDLEFVSRGQVALTLAGVPVVEMFRHNILEARAAFVQVREVMKAANEVNAVS